MKKKRGLRKYYCKLERSISPNVINDIDENSWFDFYHFHIDNTGLGNKSWKSRIQHLDALFSIAEEIEKKLKGIDKPFQYWIEIFNHDSCDDAIYIHSKNPNNSTFPISLSFDKKVELREKRLRDYLGSKDYLVRTKNLLEEGKPIIGFFLQKKGIGITLD